MSYKATYDLAQAVGMDYVPDTCFVQLYVDRVNTWEFISSPEELRSGENRLI